MERLNNHTAKKLLNEKKPFVAFAWDPTEKYISYICISEYGDDIDINFSERCGNITPDNLFDMFYHDSFQNDGYLIDATKKTITDILDCELFPFMGDIPCFAGNGQSDDIKSLPAGNYLYIKTH